MKTFRTIEEIIRALGREKVLLREMFSKRKTLSFRRDYARALVEGNDSRIDFLLEYGIIRDSGDGTLELTEPYLRFFEEVLQTAEDINVGAVSDTVGHLEEQIGYWLMETSERRRQNYLKEVRVTLRSIAAMTLRNVIDLKRSIDNTYKNEPNYAVKRKKLQNLDAKREAIATLIKECEKILDERQQTFFTVAMDVSLSSAVQQTRYLLREAYHNLLELDRQIIEYLNLIEYQSRIVEKIRKIKYLQDQLVLETQSDILQRLQMTDPLWMEPRPAWHLKLSLETLRSTDEGLEALKEAVRKHSTKTSRDRSAPPLTFQDLQPGVKIEDSPNLDEMFASFLAGGEDLYSFVMKYNFQGGTGGGTGSSGGSGETGGLSLEQRRVLFCQMASQFADALEFSDTLIEDPPGSTKTPGLLREKPEALATFSQKPPTVSGNARSTRGRDCETPDTILHPIITAK